MTKQISILDSKEEQNANELYSVLPTVKKAVFHEPKIELLNIDCLHYMKQCSDKQFDLAIVDPPYGIKADVNQNNLGGKKGFTKGAGTYKKYHYTNWDNEVPSQEYFTELKRISKNQIVWGGNYFHELKLEGVIIWDKGNSGNFKEGELAKTSFNTFKIFGYSRADAYINDCDVKIHPTQKPTKLYKWLLKNYAKEGDKIIDTHLGSGSIAMACYSYKFDFVGLEIDKTYFDNANKRLNDYRKQLTFF